MERQIELGRAVLASPLHDLELWLTTLITLTPAENSINIQQFSNAALLDTLTSGDLWVSRGRGLYMDVVVTLRGEPLGEEQSLRLAERIMRAPVWEHLQLRSSFPTDGGVANVVRLCICHDEGIHSDENKGHHRMFRDINQSNIKPPESVARLEVNAIYLCMDILEARPRPPLKRSRTAPTKIQSSTSVIEAAGEFAREPVVNNVTLPLVKSPLRLGADKLGRLPRCKPGQVDKDSKVKVMDASLENEEDLIDIMVDGALRLASCGGLATRHSNGLKIKANTFSKSLADVLPNLWKPGHLEAVSRRACLLPTICRSLSQLSRLSANSPTLHDKIEKLKARSGIHQDPPHQSQTGGEDLIASSIAKHTWLHLQRNVTSRTNLIFPAFLASGHQDLSASEHNDMLEPVDDTDQERLTHDQHSTSTDTPDILIANEDDIQLEMDLAGATGLVADACATSCKQVGIGEPTHYAVVHDALYEQGPILDSSELVPAQNPLVDGDGLVFRMDHASTWGKNDDIPSYENADQRSIQYANLFSYDGDNGDDRSDGEENILMAA